MDRFMRRLDKIERLVMKSASSPQLGNSSIEGGSLVVNDSAGGMRMQVGEQYDGTTTTIIVNGPTPPTPSTPTAVAALEGAVITWDGLYTNAVAPPMDFARVEVHASTDPDFTAEFAQTLVATFETPRGGSASVTLVPADYYIKFVTRSQSGLRSPASAAFQVTPQSVPEAIAEVPTTDGDPPVIPGGWTVALAPFAIGALEASWTAVPNADPVTYDVYLAEGAPVAVLDATTFLGSTTATRFPIRSRVDGSKLLPNTGYYVAVRPRDADDPAISSVGTGPVTYRQADTDEISATWAYFGEVEANKVKSGILEGDLVVGNAISAGDGVSQRKVALTPEGLLVTDVSGATVVKIPTSLSDDITINANILAKTLTAEGLVSLNNVTINKAKTITLLKGIQEPASPLVMANEWPVVLLPSQPGSGFTDLNSTTYDAVSGNVIYTWSTQDTFTSPVNFTNTVETRNSSTGAKIATLFTTSSSPKRFAGSVLIGSWLYVLTSDGLKSGGAPRYWVEKWSTLGVFQSRWEFGSTATWDQYALSIIDDGGNVMIGYKNSVGQNSFATFDPNSGSVVTAPVATPIVISGGAGKLVYKGAADFGGTRVVFLMPGQFYVFNTSGTRDANFDWPDSDGNGGSYYAHAYYSGGLFRRAGFDYIRQSKYLASFVGDFWSGATTRSVKGTATHYDNNSTGGTHETIQGPVATLVHKKRARISGSISSIPGPSTPPTTDDVTGWRMYLGLGSGTRTTQWLAPVGSTGSSSMVQTIDVVPGAGINPPSSNNFPNSTPSKIQDSTGTYYFDANGDVVADDVSATTTTTGSLAVTGAGNLGPFVVNGSGVVTAVGTSTEVAASADATVTSTTNATVAGLSISLTSTGTTNVWEVHLDPDVAVSGTNPVNFVELLVDGSPHPKQIITQSPTIASGGMRVQPHKTYKITGLSAGPHSLTVQTRMQATSSTGIVRQSSSTMMATRIA